MRYRHEWNDENLEWGIGYNLKQWMFGFAWYDGGFSINFGPFFFGKSDMPF